MSSPAALEPRRHWFRRLLGGALTAVALFFVVRRLAVDWRDWDEVRATLAWGDLVLHLLLMAASFALLVAAWQRVVTLVGGRLAFAPAASTWFAGAVARYIPGKVTAFLARLLATQGYGVERRRAATALIIEQAMYVGIAVAVVGATTASGLLVGPGVAMAGAAAVLVVAGLVALLHPALLRRISGLLQRIAGVPQAEFVALSPGRLLPAALLAIAGWTLHGVAGFFLVRAVTPLPLETIGVVSLAFVAAWGAGFLAFVTPAGLGVREATLVLLLAPIVPRPLDAMVALLGRLSWLLLEVAGLALSAAWARRSRTAPRLAG